MSGSAAARATGARVDGISGILRVGVGSVSPNAVQPTLAPVAVPGGGPRVFDRRRSSTNGAEPLRDPVAQLGERLDGDAVTAGVAPRAGRGAGTGGEVLPRPVQQL